MNDFTNFNSYSHDDLHNMVHSMDSGGIMSASDPWRRAADTLKQIRTALNTASGDATSSWEGATSDAFYSKMTKLANSVNNVSAYANDAAVTLQMVSQAIDQAKQDMPEKPGFWDQVGDAVSDTAKSSVGVNDEDTNTSITDEKKAQAVGVMEILATKYRAASASLKPPPANFRDGDVVDITPPDDPSGAAAIGALIMGGGMGLAGAQGGVGTTTSSRSSGATGERTPQSPRAVAKAPTDSGIKGGTANPAPKPQVPGSVGPGTGIDGVAVGTKPTGTGGGSGALGDIGDGSGHGGVNGTLGEPGGLGVGGGLGGSSSGRGLGGSAAGRGAGTGRGGGAFGAGGIQGGAVGKAGAGGTGRGAFTEGGSGLGRGRGQAGKGLAGQGHGGLGGAQANKKDKKKNGQRPDYLVEDEETWASRDQVNPNVVE